MDSLSGYQGEGISYLGQIEILQELPVREGSIDMQFYRAIAFPHELWLGFRVQVSCRSA